MIFASPWMTFGPPAVPFVAPPGGNWAKGNFSAGVIVTPVQAYKNTIIEPGQTDQQTKQ